MVSSWGYAGKSKKAQCGFGIGRISESKISCRLGGSKSVARTNLDGSATGEQVRTDYRLTFGRYQEQINLVPDSFMLLARPGGFWVLIILLGVWRPTVVLSYSLS